MGRLADKSTEEELVEALRAREAELTPTTTSPSTDAAPQR